MDLSNEFMPQFYVMDPTEEDVLFGNELNEGMVVLLEPPNARQNPERSHLSDNDMHALRTHNRWCIIERLVYTKDELVTFIGRYADGTKSTRGAEITTDWFVKKDSIPANSEFPSEPTELPQPNWAQLEDGRDDKREELKQEYVVPATPNLSAW